MPGTVMHWVCEACETAYARAVVYVPDQCYECGSADLTTGLDRYREVVGTVNR